MNEFKYQLSQVFFLILLGLVSYWAFAHLDNGVSYTRDQIVNPEESIPLQPDTMVNTIEIKEPQITTEPEVKKPAKPVLETPVIQSDTESTALIQKLADLAGEGTILSSGTQSDSAKLVQEFLNIYFEDKEVLIDGDFGPGTKKLVREFQVAELNGGDGRVGPNTIKKMIEILED